MGKTFLEVGKKNLFMQMAPTAAFVATSCRLTTEHQDRAHDRGFVGPPHHFGDNKDSATKKRSQAESERRKEAGRCFKCSVGDASEAPSLYCPLHGLSASPAPNTPTGRPGPVPTRRTGANRIAQPWANFPCPGADWAQYARARC